MCAIPARVAGCDEVYLTSPVLRDGSVPPVKLVAADIAGVDGIFKAGGAQGIAAFAYGTETVPRVDKICGPGGLFVTLAKKHVFGDVGIDSVYGPTETIVIADDSAKPAWVASDLLAQAEHDVLASAILLTPSRSLAEAVQVEVSRQLETLPRAEIVVHSLRNRGGIVLTKDLDEAVELSNLYGPEHLCLAVGEPWLWWERRLLTDGELERIIHDRKVEIYVLYVDGVPAGYTELDRRNEEDVELAYFGLIPQFIGRKLGPFLLNWAVDTAWFQKPKRVSALGAASNFPHRKLARDERPTGFAPGSFATRQERGNK